MTEEAGDSGPGFDATMLDAPTAEDAPSATLDAAPGDAAPSDDAPADDDASMADASDGSLAKDGGFDAATDADAGAIVYDDSYYAACGDGGPCNLALQFNGSSDVAFLNTPVGDDFTLEAFVKPSAASTQATAVAGSGIFFSYLDAGAKDYFATLYDGGVFSLTIGAPTGDQHADSTSVIAQGVWTHVAVVRYEGAGNVSLYINGAPAGTTTGLSSMELAQALKFAVGKGPVNDFNGLIDEVRVWDITRDPATIASDATKAALVSRADFNDLKLYWRFDETVGTTASDSSGAGRNGSYEGAPVPVAVKDR